MEDILRTHEHFILQYLTGIGPFFAQYYDRLHQPDMDGTDGWQTNYTIPPEMIREIESYCMSRFFPTLVKVSQTVSLACIRFPEGEFC